MSQALADSLPNSPIDGHTILYWSSYDDHLRCIKMIYHANTRWIDHPWSRSYTDNRPGEDFVDDWSIEVSSDGVAFQPTARACGWDIKHSRLLPLYAHETRNQASQALFDKLDRKISNLESQLKALREQQATLPFGV